MRELFVNIATKFDANWRSLRTVEGKRWINMCIPFLENISCKLIIY